MKTVLITGGTGFVGAHLTQLLLKNNYAVMVLTRNKSLVHSNGPTPLNYAYWDVEKRIIDESAITKADYIIHLAGAGIAEKRWTKRRKEELVNSRVNSSKLLVDALAKTPNKVQAVVSASAIGWYDSSLQQKHTEGELPANDFLGNTCKLWEESIEPIKKLGIRLVKLRLGIVLSKNGGMLQQLVVPLQFGIAPVFSWGKQVISWVHVNDLCCMFLFAIENNSVNGVYNATAPAPVTQKKLVTTFAKNEKKNAFLRIYIPAFILKIALGEMSIELLKSVAVSSNKIQQLNFTFNFPDIDSALQGRE